jgi:hypothetical protein
MGRPATADRSLEPTGRGALGTAAGVAGGVMLAESLSSLFSPHLGGTSAGGLGGLFGGTANAAEQPVQETIINNNYFGNDGNDQNDNGQTNVDYASNDQDDNDDDYDDSSDNGGDDSSFA